MTREEFKAHVEGMIESGIQEAEKRVGQKLSRRHCFSWIAPKTEPRLVNQMPVDKKTKSQRDFIELFTAASVAMASPCQSADNGCWGRFHRFPSDNIAQRSGTGKAPSRQTLPARVEV